LALKPFLSFMETCTLTRLCCVLRSTSEHLSVPQCDNIRFGANLGLLESWNSLATLVSGCIVAPTNHWGQNAMRGIAYLVPGVLPGSSRGRVAQMHGHNAIVKFNSGSKPPHQKNCCHKILSRGVETALGIPVSLRLCTLPLMPM
jgi:hypothetical protein